MSVDESIGKHKIFIVGIPKCGTTSFHSFFNSLGLKSGHWNVKEGFIGHIMTSNHMNGRPLLSSLEDYDVLTQMDVNYEVEPGTIYSHWPQMSLLDTLINEHPDAYYILNTRNTASHVESLISVQKRHELLEMCDIPGLPSGKGKTRDELCQWVEWHQQYIRDFFGNKHPSIKFKEINIQKDDVVNSLQSFLPIPLTHQDKSPIPFPHENSR